MQIELTINKYFFLHVRIRINTITIVYVQRSLRELPCLVTILCGLGSSVGKATGDGLDGPWIESWWGRDFLHPFRLALGPTQLPVQWVPSFSRGGRKRLGRDTDPSPCSSAEV
jgi:hypothetical protein